MRRGCLLGRIARSIDRLRTQELFPWHTWHGRGQQRRGAEVKELAHIPRRILPVRVACGQRLHTKRFLYEGEDRCVIPRSVRNEMRLRVRRDDHQRNSESRQIKGSAQLSYLAIARGPVVRIRATA